MLEKTIISPFGVAAESSLFSTPLMAFPCQIAIIFLLVHIADFRVDSGSFLNMDWCPARRNTASARGMFVDRFLNRQQE
jgi:hypothetical protein